MFDSFCKRVIKNAFRDQMKALRSRLYWELLVPDITKCFHLATWNDHYPSDSFLLKVGGYNSVLSDEILYLAVKKLSREQQHIIILSYWYGFRDKEIAQAVNIPRSTVNYRRNAALKKLRSLLGGRTLGVDI